MSGKSRGAHVKKYAREKVIERDKGTCQQCGVRCCTEPMAECPCDDALTIDHILPKHLGGSNVQSNLQVLCSFCNQEKAGNYIYSHAVEVKFSFQLIVGEETCEKLYELVTPP